MLTSLEFGDKLDLVHCNDTRMKTGWLAAVVRQHFQSAGRDRSIQLCLPVRQAGVTSWVLFVFLPFLFRNIPCKETDPS